MANKDPKQVIEGEVVDALAAQTELQTLQNELMESEKFRRFMELNQAVNNKMAELRANVEAVMVPAYQRGEIDKSLKADWGSITVTERDDFEVDEEALPAKFWKKVVDTTKIRKTYQLEGKAPKGCTPNKKYGIMIKFKQGDK